MIRRRCVDSDSLQQAGKRVWAGDEDAGEVEEEPPPPAHHLSSGSLSCFCRL